MNYILGHDWQDCAKISWVNRADLKAHYDSIIPTYLHLLFKVPSFMSLFGTRFNQIPSGLGRVKNLSTISQNQKELCTKRPEQIDNPHGCDPEGSNSRIVV